MRKIVLKLKSHLANTEFTYSSLNLYQIFVRFVLPKDTAEESMFLCACISGFFLAEGTGMGLREQETSFSFYLMP